MKKKSITTIHEKNRIIENLVLIGIQKKGVFGGIRGRIFGKGQKGKAGQTDKEQRQIQAKTRSGI